MVDEMVELKVYHLVGMKAGLMAEQSVQKKVAMMVASLADCWVGLMAEPWGLPMAELMAVYLVFLMVVMKAVSKAWR